MMRAGLFASAALALAACAGPDGPPGDQGTRGDPGESHKGLLCWDKNADSECTSASEDLDHNGKCDIADCRGAAGDPGLAGVAGTVGPTGPDGPQGLQGAQGAEGAVGQRGLNGGPGVTGPVGGIGPAGATGPAGPSGPRLSLNAEYEFDEVAGSTSFADTGGAGNAMIGNNPPVTSGSNIAHAGKSIALNGSEGVLAADGNTVPDTSQIWAEMWIRPTDAAQTYTFIEKTGAYKLRSVAGVLQWTVTTAGGPCIVQHTNILSTGAWIHISGWYDGLNLIVEQDGVPVSTSCKTGPVKPIPGSQLTIGGRFTGAWTEVFRGNIDEVRVRGVAPFTPTDNAAAVKGSVYRWGTFHTYQQSYGWWWGNSAGMQTLGIAPSSWTDGNATVDGISSNKDWLRSVLVNKGYGGKNAAVVQDNFYYAGSTDGPVTIAMFRIKNTTNAAINWTPQFAMSFYQSWGERASIALNGGLQWVSSGDCNSWACQNSVAMSIPANRTSSVLFCATGGNPSTNRSNVLVIDNDSADLPAGLQYVDDFDTMSGDWSQ